PRFLRRPDTTAAAGDGGDVEHTRLVYRRHSLTAAGLRVGGTVYHDVQPFPGGRVNPRPLSIYLSPDETERVRLTLNARAPMDYKPLSGRVSGTEDLREALNAELPALLAARQAKG